MPRARSLAVRAFLALLLIIAFYVLVAAIVAGLVWVALGAGRFGLSESGRAGGYIILVSVICLGGAALLVWSVLPRIDRFEPPGPELSPDEAPQLFDAIRGVADSVGQPAPDHVYLVSELNAFVTHRGGIMGIASRRVMGVGLPLLQVLTVSELRGVLAHEFGHFHGGDTRLGPWIYKTQSAIGRAIINLHQASDMAAELQNTALEGAALLLRAPFDLFGRLFLRVTLAVRRGQELSADELAARTVGSEPVASGLEKVHAGAAAYRFYLGDEVSPVLAAGFLPPLAEGFRHYLDHADRTGVLEEAKRAELERRKDRLDSHPPLGERVAEVRRLDHAAPLEDRRPAIELLADVAALEARLAPHLEGCASNVRPISWDDTIRQVHERAWRREAHKASTVMDGLTPAVLPRDPQSFENLLRQRVGDDYAGYFSGEEVFDWSVHFIGSCLCVALLDRGYQAASKPGQALVLSRGDNEVQPFAEVSAWVGGDTSDAAWRARLEELDLHELDFATLRQAKKR